MAEDDSNEAEARLTDGTIVFLPFTYSQVETALAKLHDIDKASIGAFRGRIKNLQRIGIVPASPGKGKKIRYTFSDVVKWGLCLEFSECGMAPEYVKRTLDAIGDRVLEALRYPRPKGKPHLILRISPSLLRADATRAWINEMPSADEFLAKARLLRRQLTINLTLFRQDLISALESGSYDDSEYDDADDDDADV